MGGIGRFIGENDFVRHIKNSSNRISSYRGLTILLHSLAAYTLWKQCTIMHLYKCDSPITEAGWCCTYCVLPWYCTEIL